MVTTSIDCNGTSQEIGYYIEPTYTNAFVEQALKFKGDIINNVLLKFAFYSIKIHLDINGKMPKGYKELIHENTTDIPTSTNMLNSKSLTQLP